MTTCYVTSDLHVGDGGNLDDFAHDALFANWLEAIAGDESVLVLNGDVVDFAQIPPLTVKDGLPSFLLWDERQSLEKLEAAITAHPGFFDALAAFVGGGGALRIIIGNHDLDMVWSGVQARIRERIGATDTNLLFEISSTSFADVLIQHGHQATGENCPKDPNSFVHRWDGDGVEYLERVWGTDFVLHWFNHIHDEYPFANNIKPTYQLLFQGLKNRWIKWRHVVRAAAFLARSGIPVRDIASAVLAGEDDEQPDLAGLPALFEDDEIVEILLDSIADLGADGVNDIPDETLDASLRAALKGAGKIDLTADEADVALEARQAEADAQEAEVDASNEAAAGAVEADPVLGIFRESREFRAALDHIRAGAHHVVFGHTHEVVDGMEIEQGACLFNPGTWIPKLDLRNPEVRERRRTSGITKELLNDASAYKTRLYAVVIRDDGMKPELQRLEGFG